MTADYSLIQKAPSLRLAQLEHTQHEDTRYVDLSLKLRRKKTGEILLRAGGRWDRVEQRFVGPAPRCRVIDVEESQVEFVRFCAEWLRCRLAGLPRERLVLAGGPRRSGKTFISLFCLIAIAIAVPNSICWLVSPTFQKRDELERLIKNWLPRSWWRYRDAPAYRFTFVNGATVQGLSGDDPEALKRGGASAIMWNEAQEMSVGSISYGLPAIIDDGGLGILAANPPRRQKGEWILALRDGIADKTIPGGVFVPFNSGLNEQIDQSARNDVGKILALIDPRAAVADDEGAWIPVGDRAYPAWKKQRNAAPLPDLGDITPFIMKKRTGRGFGHVFGIDFQGWPYHCAAVLQIIRNDPLPVYWFVDEVFTPDQGTEDDLIDEILDRGYDPTQILCVGDASGAWQDGKHQFRGRVSFDFFKARRFFIEPPQRPRGESESHRSRNPAIEDRLSMMFRLMEQGRLIVDPVRCPRLAEAFKDCELKNINGRKKPYGRHAHITDAAGYALWYLEPRPTLPRRTNVAPDAFTATVVRRGSDVI